MTAVHTTGEGEKDPDVGQLCGLGDRQEAGDQARAQALLSRAAAAKASMDGNSTA